MPVDDTPASDADEPADLRRNVAAAKAPAAWVPGAWTAGALLALTLVMYRAWAFGAGVPGSYDTLTYFFPYHQAVADALGSGKFPLWNSSMFLGAPLFANIQSAVLYPPNLMYLLWPVPVAIMISIITHVWWAAFGMALLCRRTFAVRWPAAFVGGAAFSLSGFFGAQAGHVNQVDAAAWLPWLLLALDTAWLRRSAVATGLAALIVTADLFAGHTQETYFSFLVVGAWGIWRLVERRHDTRAVSAILVHGAAAFIAGLTLAAVQLVPTIELTGQSIRRTGLGFGEASSFSLRPDLLLMELWPGFELQPPTTEYVGYAGSLTLLLVILAVLAGRRRPGVLFLLGMAAVSTLLAFGQYSKLWEIAFHILPGMSSFRVPARWLYVTTFAIAALASMGADELWELRHPLTWRWIMPLAGAFAVVSGVVALRTATTTLGWVAVTRPALWTLFGACLLIVVLHQRADPAIRWIYLACVALELLLAASWLDFNNTVPIQVYTDYAQTVSYLRGHPEYGRALSIAIDAFSIGDAQPVQREAAGTVGTAGEPAAMVDAKFAAALHPNLTLAYGVDGVDGYDGGILPLANYVALKSLFLPHCDVCGNPDALLRWELAAPPQLPWLQLLGIGAVLNDRTSDFVSGGVTYDLTASIPVAANTAVTLPVPAAVPATQVGVMTDVAGTPPPAGQTVGTITVTDVTGKSTALPLVMGKNTAAIVGGGAPVPAMGFRGNATWRAYLATVALTDRPWIETVTVQSSASSGTLEVRSVALADGLTQSETILPLTGDGQSSIGMRGDLVVYYVPAAAPAAFFAGTASVTADDGKAGAILQDPKTSLTSDVVIDYPDPGPPLSIPSRVLRKLAEDVSGEPALVDPPPASGATGQLTITGDTTNLSVAVDATAPGYVVLKQSWYPGWQATVDGKRVDLYRADLALSAVAVPAGKHTVRFSYQPGSLTVGLVISAIGVLLVVLIFFGMGRMQPHQRNAPPA